MRLGFFLGLLIGALAATVAGERDTDVPAAGATTEAEPEGVIEKVKAQARLAMSAAREASKEKQAEMLRDFEAAKQPHSD